MKYINKPTRKEQQGIALLTVVVLITIFAIIGMMNVRKAKESERMAGGAVRYSTVFEAAEQSLRNAGDFLLRIDGLPYAGDGSKGKDGVANFDVSVLANNSNVVNIVSTEGTMTIVWDRETLSTKACSGNCQQGIDYVAKIDDSLWEENAIQSTFDGTSACATPSSTAGTTDTACDSYLRDIKTYTIIEQLRTDEDSSSEGNSTAKQGSTNLLTTGFETYYLITVKASGFPPGTSDDDKKNPYHARENVILQAVFARL